jgi:hypothetical protein
MQSRIYYRSIVNAKSMVAFTPHPDPLPSIHPSRGEGKITVRNLGNLYKSPALIHRTERLPQVAGLLLHYGLRNKSPEKQLQIKSFSFLSLPGHGSGVSV